MDPSLPTRGGAADRRTAGRGRCRRPRDRAADPGAGRPCAAVASCPPSRTATSTSRPGRSPSRDVAARRCARRSRKRSTASGRTSGAATWIRGTGWRDAEWAEQPTGRHSTRSRATTPAALWAKDYHSLWLNSAALALAGGDLEVAGGVVERDDARRADRHPARGVGLAVPRALRDRDRGRVGRRDPRGHPASRTAAASPPFTTRTAGSAPPRSSAASTSAKG